MKKIVYIIFIVILIFVNVDIYPKADDKPEKGDLRCPKTSAGAKYCKEYIDGNGKVYKTEITVSNNDVKVTKVVEKTDNIGEYSVFFKSEGEITNYVSPYIVVLMDTSGSVKDDLETAKNAIINFSNDLKGSNFALVQFAREVSNRSKNNGFSKQTFKKEMFAGYCEDGMGGASFVNTGLDRAYDLLKNIDENLPKYIVLFGDGEYNFHNDTSDWGKMERALDKLKTIKNLHYIGIRFLSSHKEIRGNEYTGDVSLENLKVKLWEGAYNLCYDDIKKYTKTEDSPTRFRICNTAVMKHIIDSNGGGLSIYTDSTDWKKDFESAASDIKKSLKISFSSYTGVIDDVVGSDFSPRGTKEVYVKKINEYTKSFTIKIDKNAKTGWGHFTNNGFTYFYGDDKVIESKVNPEVYWEQESLDWNYCSDVSTTSSKKVDGGEYHRVTCEQGWGNTLGYRAELKVNSLSVKTSTFNIHNGMGFPITIDLTSNLRCTIQFDKDKFMNKYDNLNKKLNELTGDDENTQKEKASIEKQINNLIEYLNNFLNKYSNDSNQIGPLKEYKNIFEQQKALLKINYTSKNYNEVNFVNKGDVNSNIDCSNMDLTNILGKNIYLNRICVLSSNKTMQLPSICLSMKGGTSEKCQDNSTSQLNGGNNYYIDLDESSGYVSVYLDNATFIGKTIKLEGNKKNDDNSYKCQFTTSISSPIYRQIELTDPFVQTYTNKKRTIGKNWLNDSRKYNFVKIIDPEIWNKTFEYQYSMSKVDVEEIKKDTSQKGVSSYLGKDCSFNNKNEYICNFVRPSTGNNGKSNYFTNITVNK